VAITTPAKSLIMLLILLSCYLTLKNIKTFIICQAITVFTQVKYNNKECAIRQPEQALSITRKI